MENHLLIGQSGSGKTRIAIRLIREYRAGENGHHVNKNPVLVLNGSAGLPADYKHTDWKSVLTEAKECSLLADDILTPEKGVRETLLVLLNKLCRHNKIAPVCIVLHSLQNTGGVPLLPFTNFVWLTATVSNANSLRYLLSYYRFPPKEAEEITERFNNVAALSDYSAFKLDIQKRTFIHVPGSSDVVGNEKADAPKRTRPPSPTLADFHASPAKSCLDLLPHKDKANATFKMLIDCLPRGSMDPRDLTISLVTKKSAEKRKISLVDYIATLQNKDLNPTSNMKMLHSYVSTTLRLPNVLVDNQVLKNLEREAGRKERENEKKKKN